MKQTISQIERNIRINIKGLKPDGNSVHHKSGSNEWFIDAITGCIEEVKTGLENLGFKIVYVYDNRGLIIATYNDINNTHYKKQARDFRGNRL
jgi:hypothetical protein